MSWVSVSVLFQLCEKCWWRVRRALSLLIEKLLSGVSSILMFIIPGHYLGRTLYLPQLHHLRHLSCWQAARQARLLTFYIYRQPPPQQKATLPTPTHTEEVHIASLQGQRNYTFKRVLYVYLSLIYMIFSIRLTIHKYPKLNK